MCEHWKPTCCVLGQRQRKKKRLKVSLKKSQIWPKIQHNGDIWPKEKKEKHGLKFVGRLSRIGYCWRRLSKSKSKKSNLLKRLLKVSWIVSKSWKKKTKRKKRIITLKTKWNRHSNWLLFWDLGAGGIEPQTILKRLRNNGDKVSFPLERQLTAALIQRLSGCRAAVSQLTKRVCEAPHESERYFFRNLTAA